MNIWHYHRGTGELLGSGVADPDPECEGNWLIPAFATSIQPPPVPPGCVAVFGGGLSGEGEWRIELKTTSAVYRDMKEYGDLATAVEAYFRRRNQDREAARRAVLDVLEAVLEQSADTEELRLEVRSMARDLVDAQNVN
ncbi:hypothetical protein NLM16_27170 [Bradyrhizobium brasilense]|uniref:hypothetical protein n=1 Tax=Bradyrhizobium brasilense TaxID=1419277 RepID=UPI0028780779|nr:hypothetical protein [Bradyrhizobium brasilense]MCP3417795.1 hypothetical protein [Bradyrhizobium brasilense]